MPYTRYRDKTEQVDILLATYTGEKYIDELIESVMGQTYPHIRLLIRDDGSKDQTVNIVNRWKQRYPEKITVITDDKGNLGVSNNMFELLNCSNAPYVMFCDQDDVWFPDKVKTMYKAIKYKEKVCNNKPVIVHCEAYATDSRLQLVNKDKEKSLQGYQTNRNKRQVSFANLLLCNPVQGASMIFNNELKKELEPACKNIDIKKRALYDSIVASVCSIRGEIFFLNRPLMYYRQHDRNLVGAKKRTLLKLSSYDEKEKDSIMTAHFLVLNRNKCEFLKKYYKTEMSGRQKEVLDHFMKTPNNWLKFFKLKLYKEFTLRQIILMMIFYVR